MNELIITNNPKVNIEYRNIYRVEFYPDADQMEILTRTRDYVHLGGRLIMHPMMGRIKPHETPYKSVFLQTEQKEPHFESIIIVEESLAETQKFLENTAHIKYDEELLDDLQFIDLQLLQSGIEEFRR